VVGRRIRQVWDHVQGAVYRSSPNSRVVVIGDGAGWSLDHDADVLVGLIRGWGATAVAGAAPWQNQPAFFSSRVTALHGAHRWRRQGISVCFPYFHGYPGEGEAVFDHTYALFRCHHADVARVQVTHQRMLDLLLETGVEPHKLRLIRIGVDAEAFVIPTADQRRRVRDRLGIPQSAVVVGSFQKDGSGWGAGLEPKLIKGPDVLLETLTSLRGSVPNLMVLLSGPARGYVRKGLDRARIPYVHARAGAYGEMPALYHALDAYLVTSRQEGGPKAILESMASGVPVVSTRVGQAPGLIRHGENGWLAEVGDVEAIAAFARLAIDGPLPDSLRQRARETAEAHTYRAQVPAWRDFFSGILDEPRCEKTINP
jgi:glycosyltransferase involved in cell wall biosynthesis